MTVCDAEFTFGAFTLPCLKIVEHDGHYYTGKNLDGFVFEVFWRGEVNGV